jgi:sodium transport system ATP-binding protein
MIQTNNLSKSFQGRQVVKDLSFVAPDGAITGLLGANGAGKTTTLRMICGVLKPDSGEVAIDDVRGESASLQRHIGALLDHIGLYARLSARENLEYFGQLRGIESSALRARIDALLATLRLEAIAEQRTVGFSQGERMKTALGRALLHSPKNVLLDEPTNGLDIPTIRALRDVLRKLRDAGACIVFSSHVLDEVRTLCDRVVLISDGRVVAQGSPEELCTLAGTECLEDAFVGLTSAAEVC